MEKYCGKGHHDNTFWCRWAIQISTLLKNRGDIMTKSLRITSIVLIIIFILMILAMSILLFSSCGKESELIPSHEDDSVWIDQMLASEIKIAYFEILVERGTFSVEKDSPEKIIISPYYGNLNGYELVWIKIENQISDALAPYVELAGYEITFEYTGNFYLYSDGVFYTLEQAYNDGLISEQTVRVIGAIIDPAFYSKNFNQN